MTLAQEQDPDNAHPCQWCCAVLYDSEAEVDSEGDEEDVQDVAPVADVSTALLSEDVDSNIGNVVVA